MKTNKSRNLFLISGVPNLWAWPSTGLWPSGHWAVGQAGQCAHSPNLCQGRCHANGVLYSENRTPCGKNGAPCSKSGVLHSKNGAPHSKNGVALAPTWQKLGGASERHVGASTAPFASRLLSWCVCAHKMLPPPFPSGPPTKKGWRTLSYMIRQHLADRVAI